MIMQIENSDDNAKEEVILRSFEVNKRSNGQKGKPDMHI